MNSLFQLLITITYVSSIAAVANASTSATTFLGEVSKVVDGDTIHFHDFSAGETKPDLKIRMVSIDAPEQHLPVEGGMVGQGKFGEAATAYLDSLTPAGTRVTLVSLGLDKYHRVLGRYYYRDRDVNLQMVRGGWAVPYIICEGTGCNERFFEREKVGDYLAACDEARSAHRGIFHPSHILKEMPYEFRLRMQKRDPDKYVGDYDTRKLHEPDQIRAVDLCRRIFFLHKEDAERAGFSF